MADSKSLKCEENEKVCRFNWDEIANKLLEERMFLTALELHVELVESGHQLPRLRDYFSNPANFDLYSIKSGPDSNHGNSNLRKLLEIKF